MRPGIANGGQASLLSITYSQSKLANTLGTAYQATLDLPGVTHAFNYRTTSIRPAASAVTDLSQPSKFVSWQQAVVKAVPRHMNADCERIILAYTHQGCSGHPPAIGSNNICR